MIEHRSDASHRFREFAEKIARLIVPEDDDEGMRERRSQAAREAGCPIEEVTDEDVVAETDDEFLSSEALALWRLIREARELLKSSEG